MSECLSQIDDFSSSSSTIADQKLTTTETSVTSEDTLVVTKSREEKATLDNNIKKKNNSLVNEKKEKKLAKVEVNKLSYTVVDGKKIRSALAGSRRRKERRVSFPDDDKELVTGYLEPANPWEHAEDVSRDILISTYIESCERHRTEPLKKVLEQLEALELKNDRCEELCLHNETLEKHCEPLEEILKRVQFKKIDLESSGLTDESAEALFDMVEYYESAKHVNISRNGNIGTRGWQACSQMIKKTRCLEQLDAKSIVLTQQHMNILKRPLQLVSHLQVLKVENCRLAGPAFVILVAALKLNTGLKELYLADNGLEQQDGIQLGALLRVNNCLQLLDISNNNIRDEGVHNILDGMACQSSSYGGLKILILWNNHLTKNSAGYFAETIARSKTLETLNIGQNGLGDEFLDICKDALKQNTTLLQLGVQATGLMNRGVMALAEVVGKNNTLQRIDLRDNHIQLTGLTFLCLAMKKNYNITQIDLDDNSSSKAQSMMDQYITTVTELRSYCHRNDEEMSTDSSTEESGSPQHRSRLSSVNSRKISLTCQTLPRSPNTPTSNDVSVRNTTMLEPKRTSGGRLRSPAPSPIPSPVASPIPSPSRSRFVVSRVSEASLSSTNSSASSSPVTPPSLASSPTCFFPNTSSGGSSRFRVTVVEPNAPTTPTSALTTKNVVVTPDNTNVTIGFNYRVDVSERIDSDDSDSVFRSEGEEDSRLGSESTDGSFDERVRTPDSGTVFDVDTTITTSTRFAYSSTDEQLKLSKETSSQPDNKFEFDIRNVIPEDNSSSSAFAISKPDPIEAETEKISHVNRTLEPEAIIQHENTLPKTMEVPKQSSLERLLGLFQHPGHLFTSSFTEKSEVQIKNPLQGSVNSMIALGDRFQQYLRDSTTRHVPLQRSVSDAPKPSGDATDKSDPVKSLSIDHISTLEMTNTGSLRLQALLDEAQEPSRRLSEVQEDDNELDNLRIENHTSIEFQNEITAPTPVAAAAAQIEIDNNYEYNPIINDSIATNSDNSSETTAATRVPVLTFKSEYSITIGDCDENNEHDVFHNENVRDNIKCDNNGTKDSINTCNLRMDSSSIFPIVQDELGVSVCNHDSTSNNADNVHNHFINNDGNTDVLSSEQCKFLISDDGSGSVGDDCCRKIDSPVDSVNNNNSNSSSSSNNNNNNNNNNSNHNNNNNNHNSNNNNNNNHNNNNNNNNNNHNQGNDEALTIEEEVKEILVSILNVIPEVLDEEAESTNDCLIDFHSSEIDKHIFNSSHNCDDKKKCDENKIELAELTESDKSDEIRHEEEKSIDLHYKSDFNNEINVSQSGPRVGKLVDLNSEIQSTESIVNIAENVQIISDCPSESEGSLGLDCKNELAECQPTAQTRLSDRDRLELENLIDLDNMMKFDERQVEVEKLTEIDENVCELDRRTEVVEELRLIQEEKVILKISTIETETSKIINQELITTNVQNSTSSSSSTMEDCENFQTARSPTNLFIDKSRNIHRNSQDSGIEEANVSISDDNVEISPQPRDSFQESLDSGVDSECSSVCTRVDNVQSLRDNTTDDKYYNIPVIDAHESQSISSKTLLIKASVFVNNGDEIQVNDEMDMQSESKIIDSGTDVAIIGAKLGQEEEIVSTSTGLK